MLSSIGYGDLVRVFWSSRWYGRVYLGSFIFGLVWRLFTMKSSRRSVKARYSFGSISPSLSTGFQVYLSKCWGWYASPSCTICFFLQFFSLISAFWSCQYLSKGWVPSLRLLDLGSVYVDQIFGSRISFLCSFLFFLWSVLLNGINKFGWCHARGRGCWLKGWHQIPQVSSIFHQSLHLHIYQSVSFLTIILCPFYCYYSWCGNGIGGRWLIHNRVWVGGQQVVIISYFFFVLFFFGLRCPVSFRVSRAW